MKTDDYYDTLGVCQGASGDEIKQAYRRLAKRFHPDVSDDPNGERKFKTVGQAYKTLKCQDTRVAYDRELRARPDSDDAAWAFLPFGAWCIPLDWSVWLWMWSR